MGEAALIARQQALAVPTAWRELVPVREPWGPRRSEANSRTSRRESPLLPDGNRSEHNSFPVL